MRSVSGLVLLSVVTLGSPLLFSSARGAEERRAIPSEKPFDIRMDWFDAKACADAQDGLFHFQLGTQLFAVDPQWIEKGVLKKVAVARWRNYQRGIKVGRLQE